MTGSTRETYRRADSDASHSSVSSSGAFRADDSQIVERVKHAFVLCKRWSPISWTRARADNDRIEEHQGIEFTNMSPNFNHSISTLQQRRLKDTSRPLLLNPTILREDSSAFYNDEAIDPFITSPSWLKTEHTADETRAPN